VKALKVFLTVISCIVLTMLIFVFSLIFTIKSFLVKEVSPKIIRELLRVEYVKTNELDKHKLEVLDRVFYDKNTGSTIEIILDNFVEYRENKSAYKVKEKDLKKVREFMVKHKQDLSDFSGEKLTDKSIEDHFQVEVINDEVIDIFEKVYKDLNEEEKLVIDVYTKVTSNNTKTILLTVMAVLEGIIILLNLPITKAFGKIGVSVLISGIFLAIVYALLIVLRDKFVSSIKLNIDLNNIKFNMFLIWSIVEIVLGTSLIIIKKNLFNKTLE